MHLSNRGVLLVGLVVLLVLGSPVALRAQATPDLVVTLRDAAGVGVVGATITVHDRDGEGVLAQVQTDANGIATITTVLMSDVQVAVTGKGSDGTSFQQLASDTGGIALFLDGRRTMRLDLRVEVDGTVIPDPQTMVVPDVVLLTAAPTVLAVILPTSRGAPTTVQPASPLIGMAPPVPSGVVAATVPPAASSPARLVGLVLVSLVIVAVATQLGMRVWRERRSQ